MASRQVITECLAFGVLADEPRYWRAWENRRTVVARNLRAETSKDLHQVQVDFSKYTPKDYLLSWATAVGGVETEADGHTIVVPHGLWVNDNGNAWTNQVLLESYPTFILAENYLEHVQQKPLSKGKVLDAVAWVLRRKFPGYVDPIPTLFVDCLVATHKKHFRLCEDIRARRINTMSMGTNITHSQCSRTGRVFVEGEDEPNVWIREHLGKWYRDDEGNRRRVAELCGVPGIKGSNEFLELSWVKVPAFAPAKLHGHPRLVDPSQGQPLKALVPRRRYLEAAED